MSYIVEGASWDLAGKLYQTIYPYGLAFHVYLKLATERLLGPRQRDDRGPNLPTRIIHAGIIVHGYVYEYSNEGVKKTESTIEGDPGSFCSVAKFLERRSLGTSNLSLWDFDSWVAEQKNGRFGDDKYSVVNNQCCHFAIEACEFLEVDYPIEWKIMCEFTEKNPGLVRVADGFTRSSASGSSTS